MAVNKHAADFSISGMVYNVSSELVALSSATAAAPAFKVTRAIAAA